MTYEPGARIGKYEIRRKLGQGAMGEVFVAYDTVLERDAALKVMATSSAEQSDLRTRFEREAKAVARLQHPNIVTVYDFGYDEDQAAYIVMELLRGQDLEKILKTEPPPVNQSLRIVLQVCRGLAHAHANDIVHRDIKPANIFVAEGGLVKIMDFGIARWTQASQTKTGTVIGTAAFMSPEQLLGQRVDGRSDIFSLGVIFYQLLSREQPFHGEDIGQIFYRILNTQPPGLVLDGEPIPGLQRILDRALAKDLDNRYLSAHEMAQELADLIPDLNQTLAGQATMSIGPATTDLGSTASAVPPAALPVNEAESSEPVAAAHERPAQGSTEERSSGLSRLWPALVAAVGLAVGGYFFLGARNDSAGPVTSPTPVETAANPRATGGEPTATTEAPPETTPTEVTATPPSQAAPTGTPEPATASTLPASSPPAATPRAAAPPPPAVAPPPPAVSAAQRALSEADVARTALDRGELEKAGQAIARGRQLDASQAVWRDLDDRLQAQRAERDQERQARERASRFLEQALGHLEADELDEAIAAFRKVLIFDPDNAQASNGLRQVESLKAKQQQLRQPSEPLRSFSETTTELISGSSQPQLEGFSADESVAVERGSADLSVPGELVIELNPRDAKPSEPYTLTVRLHNETNTGLIVRSLELVTSYGGKKLGAGVEIPMNLRRIDARSTVLLHQASGQWKEELNAGGSITATVTLTQGKLKKVLTWSAGS